MAKFNISNSKISQVSSSGTNVQVRERSNKLTSFINWASLIGTLLSILSVWLFCWQVFGWWFFGIEQ